MNRKKLFRTIALRVRYPELFSNKVARERLKALVPVLEGKRIAVIGNAMSVFDRPYGAEIDAHDVVIRLNRGKVTDPKFQGSRTDILALSHGMSWTALQEDFAPSHVIWLTPIRAGMHDEVVRNRDKMAWFPIDSWSVLKQQLVWGRPSSGLIILHLLRTLFKVDEISLYGFDWQATRATYMEEERHRRELKKTRHNWEAEKDMIRRWAEQDPPLHIHSSPDESART